MGWNRVEARYGVRINRETRKFGSGLECSDAGGGPSKWMSPCMAKPDPLTA